MSLGDQISAEEFAWLGQNEMIFDRTATRESVCYILEFDCGRKDLAKRLRLGLSN